MRSRGCGTGCEAATGGPSPARRLASAALVAALATLPAPDASADKRGTVRAAYEVGSGTTRVKVARVAPEKGRIVEVLANETASVGYEESLRKSEEGRLGKEVKARGRKVLRRFHELASEHDPSRHVGVATSAFRAATDGRRFIRGVRKELGIDLRVISQKKEAMLGFHAAVARADLPPEQAVVWDIGSGSMQVVAVDANGEAVWYEGRTASVDFRDRIIRDIQGKDLTETDTPNPISPSVAREALGLARGLADGLPAPLARRLRRAETTVVGIGGVHYYSIRGQVGSEEGPYRREEVARTLKRRIGKTDEEIGGAYADTEVSNLILVLGYLEAWGIRSVLPVQATMVDALLLGEGV